MLYFQVPQLVVHSPGDVITLSDDDTIIYNELQTDRLSDSSIQPLSPLSESVELSPPRVQSPKKGLKKRPDFLPALPVRNELICKFRMH